MPSLLSMNEENFCPGAKKKRKKRDEYVENGVPKGKEVVRATSVKQSDGNLPGYYRMTSYPRGYALIINNFKFNDLKDRNGSSKDVADLKSLLEQFYFQVETHSELSKKRMNEKLEKFRKKKDWSDVDCACVVMMSHGRKGQCDEDTEILDKRGDAYKTKDIVNVFNNSKCPGLRNKPKIFIFQSCSGDLKDKGIKKRQVETDGALKKAPVMRSMSDMFIAFPALPGHKSNRDPNKGAWFIQTIVNVFAEYAATCDIDDLFKIVDSKINENMGSYENCNNYQTIHTKTFGWRKKLNFNPGLPQVQQTPNKPSEEKLYEAKKEERSRKNKGKHTISNVSEEMTPSQQESDGGSSDPIPSFYIRMFFFLLLIVAAFGMAYNFNFETCFNDIRRYREKFYRSVGLWLYNVFKVEIMTLLYCKPC